jgi:hypothetical protein
MNGGYTNSGIHSDIKKSRERIHCFAYCVQKALFLEFPGEPLVLNKEGK